MLDDGSVPVVGVFDLVDRHLSFDHAWVGAGASSGQQFVEDLGGDASVGIVEGVRGKTRVTGGGAPSGPERAGERQAVRVVPVICCRRVHQPPYRVVPGLLTCSPCPVGNFVF